VLDPDLADFVARAAGGPVETAERIATGASRVTWRVDVARGDATRHLVLRCDTGDGPLSGTELTLAREAAVYRALAPTPVRIPRLVAAHPEGRALLVERASGSDAFAAIGDPQQRQRIASDYFEALATLHDLDTVTLDIPDLERPPCPREAAQGDLALWRRIATTRVPQRDALLGLAFAWLETHAPEGAERIALCHGDAGPGNFLFDDDGVTALLDWEFAHWGDPTDDLAWIAVRAQLLGGFGDLSLGYRTWSRATALGIDAARLEYYRALVLTRMTVSCMIALGHGGERSMDTGIYALLLPYLRALLPEALERAGCDPAETAALLDEGKAAIAASPTLRAHARGLDPIPVS
jgi:aminoglycoside phosphotransferase (APT) family kinase protein